jgi:hypothetical protein
MRNPPVGHENVSVIAGNTTRVRFGAIQNESGCENEKDLGVERRRRGAAISKSSDRNPGGGIENKNRDGSNNHQRRENRRDAGWTCYRFRGIALSAEIPSGVVEPMSMPAIVITVVVVHADGPRLAVPGRLGAATMFGRRDAERGKQQQ